VRTSQGALGVAESQYRSARRDLEKATLIAPFEGVVAQKEVDRFEEVASGQTIYVLQTEGAYDVRVSLPETLIVQAKVGDSVKVFASLDREQALAGVISEAAPLAEGANAYRVTINLKNPPAALRPGMSAEVAFEFPTPEGGDAYAVPLGSVKTDIGGEGGTVFVWRDGVLTERKVQVVNIRDNRLQIVGDVAPGDVIAIAGVSLLYDGMAAKLLDPAALR